MTRSGIARLAGLLSLVIASAAFSAPAASQSPRAVDMDDLLATLDRLSVKIPIDVYGRDPVRRLLGELSRERCDQQAIARLGKALENASYRREATTALVKYSETCGGHAPSLRAAVNILLKLSDYETSVSGRDDILIFHDERPLAMVERKDLDLTATDFEDDG